MMGDGLTEREKEWMTRKFDHVKSYSEGQGRLGLRQRNAFDILWG